MTNVRQASESTCNPSKFFKAKLSYLFFWHSGMQQGINKWQILTALPLSPCLDNPVHYVLQTLQIMLEVFLAITVYFWRTMYNTLLGNRDVICMTTALHEEMVVGVHASLIPSPSSLSSSLTSISLQHLW